MRYIVGGPLLVFLYVGPIHTHTFLLNKVARYRTYIVIEGAAAAALKAFGAIGRKVFGHVTNLFASRTILERHFKRTANPTTTFAWFGDVHFLHIVFENFHVQGTQTTASAA
eukprot:scaffold5643_cov41-Attheya_sp.AAC.1